ncbi:MAG: S8 family serine peptidase [Jatrophihabitans sp.]|uniref:S8 family serine peptidase n=1 Tax=Jatrophihabitans sp. TaxID=1932789 RepID=UPI003F7E4A23
MRRRGAGLACALLVAAVAVGPSAPAAAADCAPAAGVPESTAVPFAQTRLGFQDVWPVTTGEGITVAVIDSGVDTGNPQMEAIRYRAGISEVPSEATVRDCVGHGTAVTGIIAAPKVPGTAFTGVAPGVTVVPIKQTNSDQRDPNGTARLAAAIEAALEIRAVRVINVSIAADDAPALRQAVSDAQQQGVVIVAAAGNDAQGNNAVPYPAGYSQEFDNVLAVAAVDQTDQTASFSEHGRYVDIAAPGVGIEAPAPGSGYSLNLQGTSFATPFVTGAVALAWSAHPELTAAQIVRRLEATAAPPPDSVPTTSYGYGIVDPVRAVVAQPAALVPASPVGADRVTLPAPSATTDSTTGVTSFAVAGGLLGLAALLGAGAALRRRRAPLRPAG